MAVGLPHLLPLFQAHEVDEVALPLLDEADLLVSGWQRGRCPMFYAYGTDVSCTGAG